MSPDTPQDSEYAEQPPESPESMSAIPASPDEAARKEAIQAWDLDSETRGLVVEIKELRQELEANPDDVVLRKHYEERKLRLLEAQADYAARKYSPPS